MNSSLFISLTLVLKCSKKYSENSNSTVTGVVRILLFESTLPRGERLSVVKSFQTVHPRRCGEQTDNLPLLDPEAGSSPQVRGTGV